MGFKMNSPNILHIPLNRQGALELGQNPCSYCNNGFGSYSPLGCVSCHDTCEYLKLYFDEEKMKQIKLKGVK